MPSDICRTVIFRPDVFDAWSNGIPRSKNQAGEIRIGNPPLDTLPIYGIGFKLALCQSLHGRNKCVNWLVVSEKFRPSTHKDDFRDNQASRHVSREGLTPTM